MCIWNLGACLKFLAAVLLDSSGGGYHVGFIVLLPLFEYSRLRPHSVASFDFSCRATLPPSGESAFLSSRILGNVNPPSALSQNVAFIPQSLLLAIH